MSEPTVSITEVEPEAVEIQRLDLRAGDTVFDTFGGKHKVAKVRHWQRTTRAVRDDGAPFHLYGYDTITVIPKEG